MKNLFTRFIRDEEGQDIVEYVLLIVFVGLLVTLGMTALSSGLNTKFGAIVTSLS
jgi:Flp pilus assembly pilin Flp